MGDDGSGMVSVPADLDTRGLIYCSFHVSVFSNSILPASRSLVLQIPYDVTRSEIVQLLGKKPNVIENHAMGCSVHIIMERPTSKTMDCFVEFQTLDSVYDQIRSHDHMIESDVIQSLEVDMSMSSCPTRMSCLLKCSHEPSPLSGRMALQWSSTMMIPIAQASRDSSQEKRWLALSDTVNVPSG